MAIAINFTMDAGATFDAIAIVENEDHSLFDLTDFTPYCQMRKSYYTTSAINLIASVEGDPLNGEVKLFLPPVITSSVKAGRYVYDIEVHHNTDSNIVKRVLQGVITVYPNVTRSIPPIFEIMNGYSGGDVAIDELL